MVGTQLGWPGVTLQRSWRRRAKRGTGWNCIMRYHEYTVSADYVLHHSGLWPQQAQRRSSNFLCWPRKLCLDTEGQRGMEWCDDLLEHKPSVWFAVYTTEEVWGSSKVWPGGLIVAWLGSQAQHHRWRLEVAYFPWKTPTSISRRHSGAHTALPKSGTWWWRLCGHINEAVLGLAGPVATSVTCMWKAVKLWRTAAINLSQPVAWLDSGTGTWDCCGAYCFRMAWQGLAASCITLLAQHMPVGGSHRAGLRKSKDAKKKRKSHIISEEGQKADDETYSSEDRLVDFINKAVLIVATQDFTTSCHCHLCLRIHLQRQSQWRMRIYSPSRPKKVKVKKPPKWSPHRRCKLLKSFQGSTGY